MESNFNEECRIKNEEFFRDCMDEYITKRIASSLTRKRRLCKIRRFWNRLLLIFLILLLSASMVWNVVGLIRLVQWITN